MTGARHTRPRRWAQGAIDAVIPSAPHAVKFRCRPASAGFRRVGSAGDALEGLSPVASGCLLTLALGGGPGGGAGEVAALGALVDPEAAACRAALAALRGDGPRRARPRDRRPAAPGARAGPRRDRERPPRLVARRARGRGDADPARDHRRTSARGRGRRARDHRAPAATAMRPRWRRRSRTRRWPSCGARHSRRWSRCPAPPTSSARTRRRGCAWRCCRFRRCWPRSSAVAPRRWGRRWRARRPRSWRARRRRPGARSGPVVLEAAQRSPPAEERERARALVAAAARVAETDVGSTTIVGLLALASELAPGAAQVIAQRLPPRLGGSALPVLVRVVLVLVAVLVFG